MKPGDFVKAKNEEDYGVVAYSTFGISLHFYDPKGRGLIKTLGDHPNKYKDHWEVIKELPEGWVVGKFGCPVKE